MKAPDPLERRKAVAFWFSEVTETVQAGALDM
jgi:hypothetical protein